jgi:hypothetical protein
MGEAKLIKLCQVVLDWIYLSGHDYVLKIDPNLNIDVAADPGLLNALPDYFRVNGCSPRQVLILRCTARLEFTLGH